MQYYCLNCETCNSNWMVRITISKTYKTYKTEAWGSWGWCESRDGCRRGGWDETLGREPETRRRETAEGKGDAERDRRQQEAERDKRQREKLRTSIESQMLQLVLRALLYKRARNNRRGGPLGEWSTGSRQKDLQDHVVEKGAQLAPLAPWHTYTGYTYTVLYVVLISVRICI